MGIYISLKLSNVTFKILLYINYTKESNFGSYLFDSNGGQLTNLWSVLKAHHRPNAVPYGNQGVDSDATWMWSGGVG